MVEDVEKLTREIKGIKSELKKAKKQKGTKKGAKILKKPKARMVVGVSSKKTLRGFAHSTSPMVREVEKVEVIQDNRSQFFKEEMEKESKWLG